MALLHVDFFSDVLGMCVNMDVILPQQTNGQIGMESTAKKGKVKTLYLLHGMSDDHTIWLRRTSIERYAFCYCEDLQSIVIPDSVTTIEDEAFINCSQLQTVVIGKGLAHVGDRAFDCCESIERVYYKGSKSDWGKIYIQPRKTDYIGRDNMDLINATRYYYSETTPTVEGNFWYYDENGEIEVW